MNARAPASHAAECLLELLAHWPRPVVSAVLFDQPDPPQALVDGVVSSCLQDCYEDQRRDTPLRFAPMPAFCIFDAEYPAHLAHIPDPPLVLFYRGELAALKPRGVAIVGARRSTAAGRETAEQMAAELARVGVAVVSGLARGIDGAAHSGALSVKGTTVAVLGSGLGQLYPAMNRALAQRLLRQGGLLLSEYPHHQPPLAFQFPERNRIISGLSEGVVVVEAGLKSGSLITARLALEQGRDVFVVPGPVTSLVSQGCHRLIRQGAELVTQAQQVADSLGIDMQSDMQPDGSVTAPRTRGAAADTPARAADTDADTLATEQRYVLELIRGYAVSLDELIALTSFSAPKLTRILSEMELAGIVRAETDGYIATSKIN